METKSDIKAIKKKIVPVLEKYGVTRAGIFGSSVKDRKKPANDIDILIKIPSSVDLDLLDFVHIKHELEEVTGKKVDLVEYSTLKPALKEDILKDEVQVL